VNARCAADRGVVGIVREPVRRGTGQNFVDRIVFFRIR
jgi:hypothetical protein